MSTSNGSIPISEIPVPGPRRPLRVRVAQRTGRGHLDGGWWPQTRDLTPELAELLVHLHAQFGRVETALVSTPDWDQVPRRVPVTGGHVEVALLPRNDTHLIQLKTSERAVLRLLVVPPRFTRDQGDEALLAAAAAGGAHSAADLLDEVTDHPDVDPKDHWTDEGEPWWGSHGVAPSFGTAGHRGPTR